MASKIFEKRITLLNVLSSVVLQFCMVASGFIIPRIILSYFGSEVNGLVSSLTQFLSYISLMEGGVSGVITASLYKALHQGNSSKVSSVVKTAQRFYRKIGWMYVVYAIFLATLYPILTNTGFSFLYVAGLTIILCVSLLIQYMFSLTLQLLLKADKKVYVVSFTQAVIVIVNILLVFISVKVYPSIHILKLITGLLYIVQPIVYGHFVRKYYKLDKNAKEDKGLIKERWNGFAINVAAFMHYNTDVIVLTVFTNLATVSIYAVYALVTNGLREIINAVTSGIVPTIGESYAKNDLEKLDKKMDLYEYAVFLLVFMAFTLAGLLIVPFVMLYTQGVTDANYFQPLFGILLVLAEAMYLLKFPHLNLAYAANKFKEITLPACLEAVINIVISVVLVNIWGIVGVAIGTLVAMIYRLIFHVWYTKKIIPARRQWVFYRKLLAFSVATIVGLIICLCFIPAVEYTIWSWAWHAVVYVGVLAVLYMVASLVACRGEIRLLKQYIFK